MGHNLYYTHTISLHDALLGFEHTLPHYDGHAIRLARTTATQPGHVSVIHGEGLPIPDEERRHSEDHGDLFVEFQVIVPEIQDKKESIVFIIAAQGAASGSIVEIYMPMWMLPK